MLLKEKEPLFFSFTAIFDALQRVQIKYSYETLSFKNYEIFQL
jgi:hypothetical protein